MKTETKKPTKLQAIKAYVKSEGFDPSDLEHEGDGEYTCDGIRFLVLSDRAATKAAFERARDELWAFRATYIVKYVSAFRGIDDGVVELADSITKIQEKLCEDAQLIVVALLGKNLKQCVQDAIDADGRGHFLALYDGEEVELDSGHYLYRLD